ncbi:hypothetical protein NLX86_16970 [Streptomyces sp. A3M-1-3]|uniref:MauE/DoxX family redox-associated membrane protein n=1 Tax=Streptomyces sp. A3M-1-3 TaxID=2962044 RepID=UPI0020B8EC8E|nr:MauE/DoxX family redox-associated membrane protein [Streptomyces sp. A3M-1-3]MCP3819728.1 hypothetical protein [Streptomyces sp. A3M-1-3]
MPYLAIGIRCLLGAIFLASSVSKVAGRGSFGAFVTSVHALRITRPERARPVAVGVLLAEFAVPVLLFAPLPAPAVPAGLVAAAGLLSVFAAGIVRALQRGTAAPCRCFGTATVPLGIRHVVRNAVLAAAAVVGVLAAFRPGPVHPGGVATAVLAGLALGALVATLDYIAELFRPVRALR